MWNYFSASVFAYGQTSSGKTYTMIGITEYTMSDIYDYIEKVVKILIGYNSILIIIIVLFPFLWFFDHRKIFLSYLFIYFG